MYYYKDNQGLIISSTMKLIGYTSLTEEEYNQLMEESIKQQEQETRAQKEALFRKLRAELYPPEEE